MENDKNSAATSKSQMPMFPARGEGNSSGMAGMIPQMTGMMSPYYNMYPWMGGMVPHMPGVSGGMMPGMMPGAAGMGE